jgi:DNA gyrase/topoisomerase IV subunit A
MNFSILAEKNEIKKLISELENAIKSPNLYYELFEDEFAEMIDRIKEIANELKQYC